MRQDAGWELSTRRIYRTALSIAAAGDMTYILSLDKLVVHN